MHKMTKTAVLGLGFASALFAGGCAGRYYDDGAYGRGYYDDRGTYRHRDRDDDSYRHHRDSAWVCDADGDDCHWERR